jgi:hypothetical protein
MLVRTRTLLAAATLAALTAVIGGCSDSSGPGRLGGTFVLRSLDGQPLPVLVREQRLPYGGSGGMATVREYTDAMRLVVVATGRDTLHVTYRVDWDPDAGEDLAAIELRDSVVVELRADSLCLRAEATDAGCGGIPVVRRTADEIVLRMFPGLWPSGRADYRFVREPR